MLLFLCPFVFAAEPSFIPGGFFYMGDDIAPDTPKIMVKIAPYRIDKTEVSISQFEQFVIEAWNNNGYWSTEGIAWKKNHPNGAGAETRRSQRPKNHPVIAVSWYEAEAYCAWKGGHLPTEAQWERAACSGATPYPWGKSEKETAVWYSEGKYAQLTHVATKAVDSAPKYQRTKEGLFHTTGNVWEWTADWYHANSYQQDSINPKGPQTGTWKTIRGGSYLNLPSYCQCTHREPARPDRVNLTTGFRCAYPVDER